MKHIIANFKSNKNRVEIEEWLHSFSSQLSTFNFQLSTEIVLCPPLPHLSLFSDLSSQPHISLGVQDLSPFPAGAYTGAVGAHNLSDSGVRYAIVGHSERRKYFHETNQEVANKVRECLANSITPILCVTREEVIAQAGALSDVEKSGVMVAFEPVEHIGTGTSDALDNILETKEQVTRAFGSVPYIYGGSVNPQTDISILQSPAIDGFLVGTACLDPNQFSKLLTTF